MAQPLRKHDSELEGLDRVDEDDFEEMDADEEAELQAELEESLAAEARGDVYDADDVLAELERETARLVASRR